MEWLRVLTLLVLHLTVGLARPEDTQQPYTERYFDQVLDHFNYYNGTYGKSTYKQRYLITDKWWNKGKGPIFIYTGNEADIVTFWNNTGFLFDIAPQFEALVVFAEHRFYGKSLPFGEEKSFVHPYVDLLTVEQALADFATLITSLQRELQATHCTVISFGGSYGGMLSAYLRMKYPNIVHGSLAASAPIFLVAGVVPRDFFFQHVTQDFHDALPHCEDRIRQAFSELHKMAAQGSKGLSQISKQFNVCKPLEDQASYRHLLGWIRNSFTNLAMFDYPYPTQVFGYLPAFPIQTACQLVLNATDVVHGLAQAAGLYYGAPKCYDIETEFVECADPTGCGVGPQSKAWDYQACTQMLMPAGTDGKSDMFPVLPFTPEDRIQYCSKTWGITPRPDWFGIHFLGEDLEFTSNIIFSNGNLDPWQKGGVLKNVSQSLVALEIVNGAHHLDLRKSHPADPDSVKEVRQAEINIIKQWLKEATHRRTGHATSSSSMPPDMSANKTRNRAFESKTASVSVIKTKN